MRHSLYWRGVPPLRIVRLTEPNYSFMREKIKIVTQPEQLQEGLFGQVFLYLFELLPYLDQHCLQPDWAVCSKLYGVPEDYVVIPGLIETNYEIPVGDYREVNLKELRHGNLVAMGNDWDYCAALWAKYFRWPDRVCRQTEEYPSLNRALGLHYRGTDKNRFQLDTNCVSHDDFLRLVRDFVEVHPDIDTIFVATDEDAFTERVRAQHRHLPVISSGVVRHHKDGAVENNFSKGDHALLDCLLLSRCKYLVKCQSALSGFAKILNPKLEAYRVAANKLAWWTWGIPYFPDAYIPKLTSRDPECQKILARLFLGDWTEDKIAMRKFGGQFKFKARKSYTDRFPRDISLLSLDGLRMHLDKRIDWLLSRF